MELGFGEWDLYFVTMIQKSNPGPKGPIMSMTHKIDVGNLIVLFYRLCLKLKSCLSWLNVLSVSLLVSCD